MSNVCPEDDKEYVVILCEHSFKECILIKMNAMDMGLLRNNNSCRVHILGVRIISLREYIRAGFDSGRYCQTCFQNILCEFRKRQGFSRILDGYIRDNAIGEFCDFARIPFQFLYTSMDPVIVVLCLSSDFRFINPRDPCPWTRSHFQRKFAVF